MNHPPHSKLPVPTSALLGGVVWGTLAAGSLAGRIDLGTIELLLLLAPLVIVPLGLELSARSKFFRSLVHSSGMPGTRNSWARCWLRHHFGCGREAQPQA